MYFILQICSASYEPIPVGTYSDRMISVVKK
jgi:hypothetical protein